MWRVTLTARPRDLAPTDSYALSHKNAGGGTRAAWPVKHSLHARRGGAQAFLRPSLFADRLRKGFEFFKNPAADVRTGSARAAPPPRPDPAT